MNIGLTTKQTLIFTSWAIMLQVYPVLYTAFALYPESTLARQAQHSPLIPEPITWCQAPETWWWLVKEISWLVFTEPQLNFKPEVGEKVGVDIRCDMPENLSKGP
jgi:hypothetical protein